MHPRGRALLWIDCVAGFTGGTLVVSFKEWLSDLHAFPEDLVLFLGLSNLAYASYSLTLATRASMGRTPSRRSIELLVIANAAWVLVCASVIASTWPFATVFGLAHVGLEGLFVGSLAFTQYRVILEGWGRAPGATT